MSNHENDDQRNLVPDLTDNTIISNANPPKIILRMKLHATGRTRIAAEALNMRGDSVL